MQDELEALQRKHKLGEMSLQDLTDLNAKLMALRPGADANLRARLRVYALEVNRVITKALVRREDAIREAQAADPTRAARHQHLRPSGTAGRIDEILEDKVRGLR